MAKYLGDLVQDKINEQRKISKNRENKLKRADSVKKGYVNCRSLLYQILYVESTKSRDMIIRIARLCDEFSLANIFITQNDIEMLLHLPSPTIVEAFDNIMQETLFTKQIMALRIDMEDKNLITFRSNLHKLSSEIC